VIEDGVTGRLVDFFDQQALASTLIDALARPVAMAPLREAGRRMVQARFDLNRISLPQLIAWVERGGSGLLPVPSRLAPLG
jgi:glycosyltransferase involved in cell wall biosynthesis